MGPRTTTRWSTSRPQKKFWTGPRAGSHASSSRIERRRKPPVKIVTRPEHTLTIQLREFRRSKKGGPRGGRMELSKSQTITVHDVSLEDIHPRVMTLLEEIAKAKERRRA